MDPRLNLSGYRERKDEGDVTVQVDACWCIIVTVYWRLPLAATSTFPFEDVQPTAKTQSQVFTMINIV